MLSPAVNYGVASLQVGLGANIILKPTSQELEYPKTTASFQRRMPLTACTYRKS